MQKKFNKPNKIHLDKSLRSLVTWISMSFSITQYSSIIHKPLYTAKLSMWINGENRDVSIGFCAIVNIRRFIATLTNAC